MRNAECGRADGLLLFARDSGCWTLPFLRFSASTFASANRARAVLLPPYTYVVVLKALQEGRISGEDAVMSAITVSKIAEEQMGGTSGALYS